jgi:hypothetical protein
MKAAIVVEGALWFAAGLVFASAVLVLVDWAGRPSVADLDTAPAWGAWDDCAPFGAADYRCPFLNPNHAEASL